VTESHALAKKTRQGQAASFYAGTRARTLRILIWLIALAFAVTLTACGAVGSSPDIDAEPEASISGTVAVPQAVPAATPSAADHEIADVVRRAGTGATAGDDGIIPGQVLVVFDPAVVTRASTTLTASGTSLRLVRPLGLPQAALYRATVDDEGLDAAATVALAAALAARPDVRAAEPDRLVHTFATPTDPLYRLLWHLGAIGAEDAWDLTTGSSDVVVAVVDTGVRGHPTQSAITHPDLVGRLLPGYDFVSDVARAGDGDGRDDDPFDPGTLTTNGTHGTHVAGTIAARANDGVGIVGVDWTAMVLPVRVLGVDGSGSLSDVFDGIAWAAGLAVAGAPVNANPARVVNLSLGAGATCGGAIASLFETLRDAGVIVVAAAGNANANAVGTLPANCPGVIAVGATDRLGRRAAYSNYGATVALMAPGGDNGVRGPEGYPSGVLSAVFHDGAHMWAFSEGTSMAAPHVAGVAALMVALESTLTPLQVRDLLQQTAVPLSDAACNGAADAGLTAVDCGAGILDARAALAALAAPPIPGSGALTLLPTALDAGALTRHVDLTLRNDGTAPLTWSLVGYLPFGANPGPLPYGVLTVDEAGGVLAPGASRTLTFELERSLVSVAGDYGLDLRFDVDGAERIVPLRFAVVPAPVSYGVSGTTVVACLPLGTGCDPLASRSTLVGAAGAASPYALTGLAPGPYTVLAWQDVDGDGVIGAGDLFGFHTTDGYGATTVTAPAVGVDLTLQVLLDPAGTPGAVPNLASHAVAGPTAQAAAERLRAYLGAR
jgi:serine protease